MAAPRGLKRCGPGPGVAFKGATREGPYTVWPRSGLRRCSPRGALKGVARALERASKVRPERGLKRCGPGPGEGFKGAAREGP